MKNRMIYIMLGGLFAIMTSCVRDEMPCTSGNDEGSVNLSVGLVLSEPQSVQTRVLEEINPKQELSEAHLNSLNIYMFIFEDTGSRESNYLRTLVHGSDIVPEDATDDDSHSGKLFKKFSTTVDGTSENAIVHIVATSDPDFEEQLANITDRSELGMFFGATGLYTSGRYPAYWKRIKLNMPINKDNKDAIEDKLSHINLIRNFARFTLQVNDDPAVAGALRGFELDGYVLVNTVDHGYIAAYSESERRFIDFEKSNGESYDYNEITDNLKYIGTRHPLSVREHPDNDVSWLENIDWNTDAKYMFERPYQSQHKTFVLAKGHFRNPDGTETAPRYIKLDIGSINSEHTDPDTDPKEPYGIFETYNLLRNMSYEMTINSVGSTNIGNAFPQDALVSYPSNNISTSVETSNLSNISDGLDKIEISFVRLIIVDDDHGNAYPSSADLMFRYYKDYRTSNTWDNENVKCNFTNYELSSLTSDGLTSSISDVAHRVEGSDGKSDWSRFRLNFSKPTDNVKVKTVRFYRPKGLSRDVTFIMRNRWEFVNNSPEEYESNVEIYPGAYSYEDGTMPYESLDEMRKNITPGYVGSQRGAQLTVMFELPDDLPQEIFPLDFTIGADRQNIENAYDGNAIVITGPSLFEDDPGGVGVMRMQFVKTVTWDYYNGSGDSNDNGHKIVCARFRTTTNVYPEIDDPNTDNIHESVTRVRVYNPYFKMGRDTFERNSHNEDIDPTRTNWYWNFSYSEWATYFTNHPDHEAGDLDDLYFTNYTIGSSNGTYMRIGSGNADNPAYSFDISTDTSSYESGCTANIEIKGSLNTNRYWKAGLPNIGYHDYNRTVYVMASFKDGLSETKSFSYTDNEVTIRRNNLTFDVATGKQLSTIKIWSTMERQTDFCHEDATRYYWIHLTLTPN